MYAQHSAIDIPYLISHKTGYVDTRQKYQVIWAME